MVGNEGGSPLKLVSEAQLSLILSGKIGELVVSFDAITDLVFNNPVPALLVLTPFD